MISEEKFKERIEEVRLIRLEKDQKIIRDINSGLINGKVYSNGHYVIYGTKGIQNYYDTRTLVEKVTSIMDNWEKSHGVRKCPINGKWMLQIRGKHLRRLLKKMPNVKQHGRYLVEKET